VLHRLVLRQMGIRPASRVIPTVHQYHLSVERATWEGSEEKQVKGDIPLHHSFEPDGSASDSDERNKVVHVMVRLLLKFD
jgi:hypothetical protein